MKNKELLNDPERYVIYFTDNDLNSFNLIGMNTESVCIGGPEGYSDFLQQVEYNDHLKNKTAVLIFNKATEDEQVFRKQIIADLNRKKITWTEPKKLIKTTLTEAMMTDPDFEKKFQQYKKQIEYAADPAPDKISKYFDKYFEEDLQAFKEGTSNRTGFDSLDSYTRGIYAGLYIIGAVSSLGKTTFSHQLADNIARTGQHVLYFSLEQSRFEMVSKSISRESWKQDPKSALSSLEIREGKKSEATEKAKEIYLQQYADNISVIEGNFGTTAGYIREYTEKYIKRNKQRPVIFVDYLQILQPEKDPDTGRKPADAKSITDANITALKRISRDFNIPVFAISSLNRSNYLNEIDFESFKESGGIEYGADVVFGLQLAVIHEGIFDQQNKLNEKRQRMNEAKNEIPRAVELVCLKNRYGKRGWTVNFKYDPRFDIFREDLPQTGKKTMTI